MPYKDGKFGTTVTGSVFSMLDSSFEGKERESYPNTRELEPPDQLA